MEVIIGGADFTATLSQFETAFLLVWFQRCLPIPVNVYEYISIVVLYVKTCLPEKAEFVHYGLKFVLCGLKFGFQGLKFGFYGLKCYGYFRVDLWICLLWNNIFFQFSLLD